MRSRIILIYISLLLPCFLAAAEEELLDRDSVIPGEEQIESTSQEEKSVQEHEGELRVRSESGLFSVVGGEAGMRGSIAMEGDSLRRKFIELIGKEPERITPIEIILVGKAGGPPRARSLAYELRHTSDRFVLRIFVDLSHGIPHEKLEQALVLGLVVNQALAKIPVRELERPLQVPPWLVMGIRESWAWSEGRGDRRLYENVFKKSTERSWDELFATTETQLARYDGVSRAVFRAQSGALVMALREQKQGKEGLFELCARLPEYEGEIPVLLRQLFPEMNLSEKGLMKWWALTMAKLSDAPLSEVMGIQETEKALKDALVLRQTTTEGATILPPEKWGELAVDAESMRLEMIYPIQNALSHLSYRCFPSYRPILSQYQKWLLGWAEGKIPKEISLAELQESREIMQTRALRARDYLDYIEISTATELSGSFEDYMNLKSELKQSEKKPRTDSVSRYLDTMERIYQSRRGKRSR